MITVLILFIQIDNKKHKSSLAIVYALNGRTQALLMHDIIYSSEEIKLLFDITKPKIAFCEVERFGEYDRAAKDLGLNVKIVTFGGGENSFAKFMKNYDDRTLEEEFK